ncbi:hypothetical protein QGX23_gp117 [Pseudomonas phage PN09]|uniref:Uncharacterized protein n=1 Tax=Pseudomonas phage PN09 TaxID=2782564 RepID=A0A7S7YC06_9CAUD|nr:hypothetical protein QGX23_gp117 [Pseudomonas phage PN09]QPB10535.1 hypothetical protein PN09_114 [Pseudomonas phage PN09]
MAFQTTGNATTAGSENRKQVDYKALNAHLVEAAGGGKQRSLPGIITGIYDLGMQVLDDAAIPVTDADFLKRYPEYDGSAAGNEAVIAKAGRENARFEEFEGNMCFRYKQKDVQQVAVCADFPQIMVDKSLHFTGTSNPMPLRLILNGEFNRLVQKPFNLRQMNHNQGKPGAAKWALAKNSQLHKLADASGLLDKDGLFTSNRIDELLGKVVQFQIRLHFNDKGFFKEDIKIAGIVPEGLPHPELPEGVTLALVQMWDANLDKTAALEARACIKNHQRKAVNFTSTDADGVVTDSPLKAVIGEGWKKDGEATPAAAPAKPVGITPKTVEPGDDDFDDDVPF